MKYKPSSNKKNNIQILKFEIVLELSKHNLHTAEMKRHMWWNERRQEESSMNLHNRRFKDERYNKNPKKSYKIYSKKNTLWETK